MGNVVFYGGGFLIYVHGSLNASRRIHEMLTKSVLGTTLQFLDKTPIGRIIARFTQDINAVDGPLTGHVQNFSETSTSMLLKLVAIVYLTPASFLPGVACAGIGYVVGQIYITAQLPIKRSGQVCSIPLNHL